ncbi:MAG: serine hydrolase [Gemmatimonadota bacterium]
MSRPGARTLIVLLSFLILTDAAPAQQPRSVADHPRVTQALGLIDVWAEAELAYDDVPGASLAVVHDQERLWAKGWGMARPDDEATATPETIYSICSISKLFTSIAAMNLWEAGELELDDPVEEHLSWFTLRERHPGLPLTVQSLLTHSSGLPRESDYPYWSPPKFDFPTRQELRQRLPDQETLYPSEHYFQYSNLGLTLAGEIVSAVSGAPYSEYVTDNVLRPLNLESTAPSIPWDSDRMAAGYSAITRAGDRSPVPPFEAEGVAPAAGYSSTVLDLTDFASWQLRLLEADSAEVLEPSTLQKMHNVHWVDPDWDVHWGLGFVVWREGDETFVGHGGSCPGFRSQLALQPGSRLAAAFAANANGVDARKFAQTAIQILTPAVSAARDTATEPSTTPEELTKYVGRYSVQPWGGEIAVIRWKGGLAMVDLPTDDPLDALQELEHIEADTFRRVREDGDLAEPIRFRTNQAGEVEALVQHSNAWPRISADTAEMP